MDVNFLVNLLTVVLNLLFELLLILLRTLLLLMVLLTELFLVVLILTLVVWGDLPSPLPLKVPFTIILRGIEKASRTDPVINNGYWLQPVGQDNVWVHSSNVQMVDEWLSVVLGWMGDVSQIFQWCLKSLNDLSVV